MEETTKSDVDRHGGGELRNHKGAGEDAKVPAPRGQPDTACGSGLVGVTNLLYNVVTARLLGPTGFAHATAVYTILMLLSCITLAFQVVCAKYVAKSTAPEERVHVFASLHQRAWIAGIGIGLLLFLFKHR